MWKMHSNSPGDSSHKSAMIVNKFLAPGAFAEHDVNANDAVQMGADETVDFIDEWSSPTRGPPRSKSWFCCSNDARESRQPNLRHRPLSCHYSIVRSEPKSQSDIVMSQLYSRTLLLQGLKMFCLLLICLIA